MTLTGRAAGSVRLGAIQMTVWLDEGTITPGTARGMTGLEKDVANYQTPISIGDWVEFFDDSALNADNLGNVPVVRKLQTTGAVFAGRVKEIMAAADVPLETTTSLEDRIAGNYLAKAVIEVPGLEGLELIEATVASASPADKIQVGHPEDLVLDVSEGKWIFGTGTHNELIPLHHVAGSTTADVTGRILCGIGMKTMEVA